MLQGRTLADAHLHAEAVCILARALLRLQRAAEVIELLEPALPHFTSVDEVATARMLYGMAVALGHDVDRGLALLSAAARFASSSRSHRAIQAEIAYSRSLAHWTKREYREASVYATWAERARVDVLSVRATQLRAFIALATGDYRAALHHFQRAQKDYALCRGRDVDLATQIIFQIAVLEMNLRSPKVAGSHTNPAGRTIPGSAFGPAISTSISMRLNSADAWLYAHDGDQVTAVAKAHSAIRIAQAPAWRLWALSSAGTLLARFGELGTAHVVADEAIKIAGSVDWNATTDEERFGLFWLAELCAIVNPAVAPAILAHYDGARSKIEPTRLWRDANADPFVVGWDAYVRGLVARGSNQHEQAGKHFRTAAARFESCGYLWRQALALIELDATPIKTRGECALDRAAIIIRDNFPHSVLARRLGPWAVAYVDPIARALTPAKRDVLRRLLEGKSPAEIASETNRALATVQTQIKSIRLDFAAPTERQLFAKCHGRGIGAPSWALATPPDVLSRTS